MKFKFSILIVFLIFSTVYTQSLVYEKDTNRNNQRILVPQENYIDVPEGLQKKILSGKLIQNLSTQNYLYNQGKISKSDNASKVILYFDKYPSGNEIFSLESDGLECYWDLWTPPMENHPYGFVIAKMPVEKFQKVLAYNFIKKMDTAEYESQPHNNNATSSIRANEVWDMGYDGTGIKIGILDSGLDSYYAGTDLPSSYDAMDYHNYPSLDPDVENITSGHGTHVTGSALGRGILSAGHSHPNNGEGPFKGAAPGADLTFLKIGGDESSSTSTDIEIAAMDAAVDIYGVDVLSMSYGGWWAHHDGSSAGEQKVDWVYNQGVPFFISAGNSADDDRHYSDLLAPNSSTAFIPVNVSDPGDQNAALSFNLVWFDGLGTTNDLTIEYYNSSMNRLTNVTMDPFPSESTRGTESRYSYYNQYVTAGTYYLKVVNNSSQSQFFHIYDDWGKYVTFENPDPNYTIGQPASADYSCAVGAYVTRDIWADPDGSTWWYGNSYVVGEIAPFSSLGPRADEWQKPDITAPGHVILSLRDTDVYTSQSSGWIDNDGISGGDANYYVMNGTSMACPIAAGAAALLLQKNPSYTPAQVYSAIKDNANTAGLPSTPNSVWGYGKLDVYEAAMAGGVAPNPSVNVDNITLIGGPGQPGNSSFILSNIGGGTLDFNITVDEGFKSIGDISIDERFVITKVSNNKEKYNKNGINKSEISMGIPSAVENKNKTGTNFEITGDDFLILDDGGDMPDGFIGWSDGSNFKWRNEFNLPAFDFELDGLDFYMRTEDAFSNKVYIGIFDGGMNLLAEGTIDYSTASSGDWFGAVLNPPINFSQGETFYIVCETRLSFIDFPAGADKVAQVVNKSSYHNGVQWSNLGTVAGYENGAFLIRAEGTIGGGTGNRVTVNPSSGSIPSGGSETIQLIFDPTGLSTGNYSGQVNINTNGGNLTIPIDFVVGVKEAFDKPNSFSLKQNYPNPFNPTTVIEYSIPEGGIVLLVIYDILGREIITLENGYKNAGTYSVDFNISKFKNNFDSGVYFYRLKSNGNQRIRKMIILK